MEVEQIRRRVKGIIAEVTGLEPGRLADDSSFVDELQLDSLALLEIAVDVSYAFQLQLEEERLQSLRTIDDTVRLVLEGLSQQSADGSVA